MVQSRRLEAEISDPDLAARIEGDAEAGAAQAAAEIRCVGERLDPTDRTSAAAGRHTRFDLDSGVSGSGRKSSGTAGSVGGYVVVVDPGKTAIVDRDLAGPGDQIACVVVSGVVADNAGEFDEQQPG